MKKFIIFIAAALAAVSVFTACGKTTDSSSSSGEASASVSSDITEKEILKTNASKDPLTNSYNRRTAPYRV